MPGKYFPMYQRIDLTLTLLAEIEEDPEIEKLQKVAGK